MDPNSGPRDGDAMVEYKEGYDKGHYEFDKKLQSIAPSGPNSSQGPPPATGDSKQSGDGDWQETLWDIAKSKGLVFAGEQIGKKLIPAIGPKLGGMNWLGRRFRD